MTRARRVYGESGGSICYPSTRGWEEPDNPLKPPAGTADVSTLAGTAHREGFERYVLDHAEPWHRKHLGQVFEHWREVNAEHFNGQLVVPYVMLAEPSQPKTYGQHWPVSPSAGFFLATTSGPPKWPCARRAQPAEYLP